MIGSLGLTPSLRKVYNKEALPVSQVPIIAMRILGSSFFSNSI
jgi:hypothetical protein